MTNDPTPTATPARRVPLGWALTLVWVLVYLHCMAQSGWVWDKGAGLMGMGMPDLGVLMAHGQASPTLVRAGEWHRLFLDALIPTTLLDLVFNVLVGFGLARTVQGFAGTARASAMLILGGVGGALTHVLVHPLSDFGGAGGLGLWMGGVGGALATGLLGNSPVHKKLRWFALRWILGLTLFVVVFGLLMGSSPMASYRSLWPGLVGGLCGGAVVAVLFGPWRALRPAGVAATAVAVLLLGGVTYGAVLQAPSARQASVWPERAQDLARELNGLEKAAQRLLKYSWRPKDRVALAMHLGAIRDLPWLDELSGREALEGWLDQFQAFASGGLTDPDRALRIDMPAAWKAWHPFEARLRLYGGMVPRDARMPVRGR